MSERGDQVALAESLEIDQGHLSRLVRAEKTPGLKTRQALFQRLGIPMEAWDEAAEQPEEPAA